MEFNDMYPPVDISEAIISIGILVVNDGQTCQNIVAEVLRRCNYQVLHTGTVYDALHALWEKKDRLDLVITNAQKLDSEGRAIIENIKQNLNLTVLLIRDDEIIKPGGELFSFSAYALNGLSIRGFDILLEKAKRMVKDKMAAENVERASVCNAAGGSRKRSADDSRDDRPDKRKKQRVAWTVEMHRKFVDAVDRLGGPKNAVPKKIVEVMGIPWLQREHVASHLQKYRGIVKNELHGLGALTSPTASTLAAFQASLTAFPQSSYSIKENHRWKLYPKIGGDDRSSKFVGFRFEGNKIDYGPIKMETEDDAVFSPTLSSSSCEQPQKMQSLDTTARAEEEGGNDILRYPPSPPLPQNLDEVFHQDEGDGDDADADADAIQDLCDQFYFAELDDTLFSQDD